MRQFLREFSDDFHRHPVVSTLGAFVPANFAGWVRESPTVALPVTLAVLLVSFVLVTRALGLGLPDERGLKKGTKVEPIQYRPPPNQQQQQYERDSPPVKQPHLSGDKGALSFAEAVTEGAHPASSQATSRSGQAVRSTNSGRQAAHAGEDGAPTFAEAVKETST